MVPMGIFLTSKVEESQVGYGVVGKSDCVWKQGKCRKWSDIVLFF